MRTHDAGGAEIINTDQGSKFTSIAFTAALQDAGMRCSMDGRGRCLDNAFIERLWRSLKYEAVYLHELANGFEAHRVIPEWIDYYNEHRPHSALPLARGGVPGRHGRLSEGGGIADIEGTGFQVFATR